MCTGASTSGVPNSTGASVSPAMGTCTAMMYAMALRRLS